MAKVQSFLLFDSTNVQNYKNWAQGIGNALSTLGWTKTTDSGIVNWSDVTTVVNGLPNTITSFAFGGAWSGGTSYVSAAAGGTNASVVTNANLTYICNSPTQYTALTNIILNATSSTLATAVSVSGTSVTYTAAVAGATTNSLVGQVFTASGGSIANNNVAYAVCISNTVAAVVLQFSGAAAQSTGTLPTLTTSNANFSVGYGAGSTQATNWIANALAGMSVVTAGFTGNTNADGTFTVLASSYGAATNAYVGMAYSSAPTTGSGYSGTLTMNTAPASDLYNATSALGHWLPYNYEIWTPNDGFQSTNPIYLRLLYLSGASPAGGPAIYYQIGTATSGNGYLTGNLFNSGTELVLQQINAPQGSINTYECDFSQYQGSFGMVLWRNLTLSGDPIACGIFIDRAKDSYGDDLSTYAMVMGVNQSSLNGGTANAQVLFGPSAGAGVAPPIWGNAGGHNRWPTFDTQTFTSLSLAGLAPALPVFPIIGYVANPCLQAILMLQGDCASGQLVNTILYGAEHTFLMSYVNAGILSGIGNNAAVGLRWD